MKVSHEKTMWLLHLPISSSPHPYPIAITVHQCSKMPQIHCLPSLSYTVFPVTVPPTATMCTKHNTPQSLSPSLLNRPPTTLSVGNH